MNLRLASIIVSIFVCMPLMAWSETFTTKVVDATTGEAISGCLVKAFAAGGKVTYTATTGDDGVVTLQSDKTGTADSVRFTHFAYSPATIALRNLPAVTSLSPVAKQLAEISVTADRPTVKQTLDAITYDVSLDPSLKDKSLWEAIERTPFVITNAKGDITPVQGYNGIEYKLNGLDDPILKGNKQNVFSSIPAKYISRIDIKEIFTSEGTRLELNIITKGRIEGISGTVNSSLSDSSWGNSVFALTKVKRFTLSASYLNTWSFGHTSSVSYEEERESNSLLAKYNYTDKQHGYRSDNHTYEVSASYDINDRTILAVYGCLWGKTSPHYGTSGFGSAYSASGSRTLDYTYSGQWKSLNDREYLTNVSLQHSFRSSGYVTGKYQFYGRDSKGINTKEYHLDTSDELAEEYAAMFPDYSNWYGYRMRTHTLQAKLYKPFSRTDELTVEAQGRYYIDIDNNSDTYLYPFGSETETGHFRHRQLNSYLRGEYSHTFSDRLSSSVAAHLYVYDNHMVKDGHSYDNTFVNLTPSVYLTYMPGKSSRFNLSYEMTKLVPSVTALDPYRNYTTPGVVSYGNPDLDPETRHQLNLRFSLFLGRNMLQFTSANRFSNNIMMRIQYDDPATWLINKTYANAASRTESTVSAYFQRRHNDRLFFKLFTSANYVNYNTYSDISGLGRGCNGWYWNNQASASYDFDSGWSIEASANAHTRYIYLQGKGNSGYNYEFDISKAFLRNKLLVIVFCENPLPIHKTVFNEVTSTGYLSRSFSRRYTASFGLTIRYKFGNLKAGVKGDTQSIRTSDIKNSYDQ